MFLVETALFMIAIILQRLITDTNLVFKWNPLKSNKDKKEQLFMKFLHIMVMELQKTALEAFFHSSLNHQEKIWPNYLPMTNMSLDSKPEWYHKVRKTIFVNLLSHSFVVMIQSKYIKTLRKTLEFGEANFYNEKNMKKQENKDI